MTHKELDSIYGTLCHFELQGGHPVAVCSEEAEIVQKHLGGYLKPSKASFPDRPVLLTRDDSVPLPIEIEVLFYKTLYHEYKGLLEDLEDKVHAFCKQVY